MVRRPSRVRSYRRRSRGGASSLHESGWKPRRARNRALVPKRIGRNDHQLQAPHVLVRQTRNTVDAFPDVVSPDLEASSRPPVRTAIRYETAFASLHLGRDSEPDPIGPAGRRSLCAFTVVTATVGGVSSTSTMPLQVSRNVFVATSSPQAVPTCPSPAGSRTRPFRRRSSSLPSGTWSGRSARPAAEP